MPTIRPSLIPMSALTTPIDRVDDERAGDHDVELRRSGAAARPGAIRRGVLRVAPDRLVARRLAVVARPGSTGRCRRAGPGRRSSGRSGRGTRSRGEAGHRPRLAASPPPNRTSSTRLRLARRPALGAPAGRSRRNPCAAARSNVEPRVHPVERVVRRDADRPARDRLVTTSSIRAFRGPSRQFDVRRSAGDDRARAHAGSPAGRPRPSGSTSTITRVPSPRRTSSRTSSSELADAVDDLVRADRGQPGRLDVGVAGAGPRRLEHRVADQGDRLGWLSAQPAAAMPRASSAAAKIRSRSSSQGSGASTPMVSARRSIRGSTGKSTPPIDRRPAARRRAPVGRIRSVR